MATGTAKQIVALKSPSFASDTRLDDLVTLAQFHVSSGAYGDAYQYALALVVCHWLALDGQGGGSSTSSSSGVGGSLKSEREGELQRSYGVPSGADAKSYYSSTTYGQEFLNLRKTRVLTPHSRVSLGGITR